MMKGMCRHPPTHDCECVCPWLQVTTGSVEVATAAVQGLTARLAAAEEAHARILERERARIQQASARAAAQQQLAQAANQLQLAALKHSAPATATTE